MELVVVAQRDPRRAKLDILGCQAGGKSWNEQAETGDDPQQPAEVATHLDWTRTYTCEYCVRHGTSSWGAWSRTSGGATFS
jgi:hypothetical protein